MTDFVSYQELVRTAQDFAERGVWGTLTAMPPGGAMMTVRGTGTLDEEVPVVNLGYSFNLPTDADAEVLMLSLGGDPDAKVALPALPRGAQYLWPEGAGGVQHPTDPERRIEFNDEETFLRDGKFVLGSNREVTVVVSGSDVKITCAGNVVLSAAETKIDGNLRVSGNLDIDGHVRNGAISIGATHIHPGDSGGTTGTPA